MFNNNSNNLVVFVDIDREDVDIGFQDKIPFAFYMGFEECTVVDCYCVWVGDPVS